MLAFIHIPKTAGTTVLWILYSSFGTRHYGVPLPGVINHPFCGTDMKYLKRFYPRLRSISGHAVQPFTDLDAMYPEVQYFTFFRDPVDRCASAFQHQVTRKGLTTPFERWIRESHISNMHTRLILGAENAEKAIELIKKKRIFCGLVERFDESLMLLQALLAPDLKIAYAKKNTSQERDIVNRLLADESSLALLRLANDEDIKLYEFIKSELYPEYLIEYGDSLQIDLASFKASKDTFNYPNLLIGNIKNRILQRYLVWLYNKHTDPIEDKWVQ